MEAQRCSIKLGSVQCTPLNSDIYFCCLLETPDFTWTTFPSWVPNLTQITEEVQMILFDNALIETKTRIYTSLKSYFQVWFHWPVVIKFTLQNLSFIYVNLCQSDTVTTAWKLPNSKFTHLWNRISTSGFSWKYQTWNRP